MAHNVTVANNRINDLKDNNIKASIYLTNGIGLVGYIDKFDDESIIFKSGQLIMRHSIATIQAYK